MDIEAFAEMTKRVIREDGIDAFLPTLCLPELRQLSVLEGVPEEELSRLRAVSIEWAKSKAKGQHEFLLAFPESDGTIRVIRSFRGEIQEKTIYLP